MKSIKLNLYISLLGLTMTACGGSGGGTGSTNVDAGIAEPTITNGRKVASIVAADQTQSGISLALNSVSENSTTNTPLLLNQLQSLISTDYSKAKPYNYALNQVVSGSENCPSGGLVKYSGEGNDTTGGTVTVTYQQCQDGNTVLNGSVRMTLSNYNIAAENFRNTEMNFTSDFTTKDLSSGGSVTIHKNSLYKGTVREFDRDGDVKKLKMEFTATVSSGSEKSSQENAIYYIKLGNSSNAMYQTAGRIFIDNLASYVDYDSSYDMSKTPFTYNASGFYSGTARYNMKDKAKLKITIASLNNVRISIDKNGDGVYEMVE